MTFVILPLLMDEDGIHCCDCNLPIPFGAEYSQRPVGWLNTINDVIVEVICTHCAGTA